MRELTERPISFNYDYPMRCTSCGAVTTVSAQDYFDQVRECHVECSSCGADVHFGRAVAAVGDPADPSLSDVKVSQLAWYHTSTAEDWPVPQRPPMALGGPLTRYLPPEVLDRVRERHADQALHVGNYQAAIESMFRRMRDQDDAASKFFLYRTALRPGITVEAGYRDENEEEAAQITQSEIRGGGFLAIRYLNVHEAMGSLSLAVCREAIESVQVLQLPLPGLTAPVPEGVVGAVEATRLRIQQMNRGRIRDARTQGPTLEQYRLEAEVRECIGRAVLAGHSPVVRDNVVAAMRCWEDSQEDLTSNALVSYWAAMAALLAQPGSVTSRLSERPIRRVVCPPPGLVRKGFCGLLLPIGGSGSRPELLPKDIK